METMMLLERSIEIVKRRELLFPTPGAGRQPSFKSTVRAFHFCAFQIATEPALSCPLEQVLKCTPVDMCDSLLEAMSLPSRYPGSFSLVLSI